MLVGLNNTVTVSPALEQAIGKPSWAWDFHAMGTPPGWTFANDIYSLSDISNIGFNADEGTFLVQYSQSIQNAGEYPMEVSDGTSNNRMAVQTSGTGNALGRVRVSGSDTANMTVTAGAAANEILRCGFAYKLNDCVFVANGAATSDGSATLPSGIDRMAVGGRTTTTGNALTGNEHQILYYPERLSTALIQELTT